MKRTEEEYFNFPICLLNGFLREPDKVLNDILYYAIYSRSITLDYSKIDQRFIYSAESLGVSIGGNPTLKRKRGQELYESIPNNVPRSGISREMFWDFYKEEKTDFERVCLLAYLALKSIIGNKTYAKIGNNILLARMDGKERTITDFSELSDEVRKYANEYQTKKIKNELMLFYGLTYYSRYTKGFYFSFKLDNYELIKIAETRRKNNKLKEIERQQKESLNKVLNELNTTRP